LKGTDKVPKIPGKLQQENKSMIKLEEIKWFDNVGTTIKSNFEIPTTFADSYKKAFATMRARGWGNFLIVAFNRLSTYIHLNYKKEEEKWDAIIDEAKNYFTPFQGYILNQAKSKGILEEDCEKLLSSLSYIFVLYHLENSYNKYIPHIPIQFSFIIEIYLKGHIPCGWVGKFPPDKGQEPIDFSKGMLLIW